MTDRVIPGQVVRVDEGAVDLLAARMRRKYRRRVQVWGGGAYALFIARLIHPHHPVWLWWLAALPAFMAVWNLTVWCITLTDHYRSELRDELIRRSRRGGVA